MLPATASLTSLPRGALNAIQIPSLSTALSKVFNIQRSPRETSSLGKAGTGAKHASDAAQP